MELHSWKLKLASCVFKWLHNSTLPMTSLSEWHFKVILVCWQQGLAEKKDVPEYLLLEQLQKLCMFTLKRANWLVIKTKSQLGLLQLLSHLWECHLSYDLLCDNKDPKRPKRNWRKKRCCKLSQSYTLAS